MANINRGDDIERWLSLEECFGHLGGFLVRRCDEGMKKLGETVNSFGGICFC